VFEMKKLAIAAIVLSLTGCAIQRFDVRPDAHNAPTHDDLQTFWVGGIGQSEEIDAAKVCGSAANTNDRWQRGSDHCDAGYLFPTSSSCLLHPLIVRTAS
jgi:hypothetical protein